MRLGWMIAVVLTTSLKMPASYAQSAPVSLPRTAPWEMNYDADSCHLRATFGSGDQKILMDLTRNAPSDMFDVTLYGKQLTTDDLKVDIEFAFGRQQPLRKFSALGGASSSTDKLPLLILSGLRIDNKARSDSGAELFQKITPEDESAATEFTIRLSSSHFFKLETGSLAAPFRAMRKCTDDLVVSWGYDPEALAKLTKGPALSDIENILKSIDYPRSALEQGQSGRVVVRFDIDATGKATRCHVLYSTAGDEFAKTTCRLILKRAKWTPALDEFGKPAKSYYIRTIHWLAEY